jgi:capsid protein
MSITIAGLAHSFITGQWKLDRARTKAFLEQEQLLRNRSAVNKMYAGAEPGNQRPRPNQLSTPEDYKQAYERIVLIRAARQMEEDMPFFDGILSDFETYVVGHLRYMSATGNPEADKVIDEFLEWQFDQCDYSQRLNLEKIAQLAVRSMKRDGECGQGFVNTMAGLKIWYVSGDRIGNPMIGANIGPNNYNGIIADPITESPIFYDIFYRVPKLNCYYFQQRLPADQFRHYYDPFRYEQYHGVTSFKNAIEHAFDMKQVIDFTKLNIKWRSAQLPYVTNEQGKPRGNGYEVLPPNSGTGAPSPLSINVDGVTQSFLKLGEGVMEYPNDFPNQQFVALMEELKRECALGSKLPLEFVYRSQTGGVVQRFFADKAQKQFDKDKRLLKRAFLNPYKNRAIQDGINSGMLNLSRFGKLATDLARFKGTWQMGEAISVDYGKEVDADIKLIDAGLQSPQNYVGEKAGRLDEIRLQIKQNTDQLFKDAAELSTKYGLPVAEVLPYLLKKFPNPAAPEKKPEAAGAGQGEQE